MAVPEPRLIVNVTRGSVACERGTIAEDPLTRMRGLLGRRSLPSDEGLLLRPAPSIHTAFMRFAIDAVFLDSQLRIVKVAHELKPWRTASCRRAGSVLELRAGEISRRGLQVGDQLAIVGPARQLAAATRVLVVASDRRFRSVASMLLSRRGYRVHSGARDEDIAEVVVREQIGVVVIDASPSPAEVTRLVAKLRALVPSVGIVPVSDVPEPGLGSLPKWGAFGSLFDAVEAAGQGAAPRGVQHAA